VRVVGVYRCCTLHTFTCRPEWDRRWKTPGCAYRPSTGTMWSRLRGREREGGRAEGEEGRREGLSKI